MSVTKPRPPASIGDDIAESLEERPIGELEDIAEYAQALAEYKNRHEQLTDNDDAVEDEELEAIEEEYSIDPSDYDDVPESGAYITVKTTNRTEKKVYRYYYWQWREGDSWKNEYIGPVPDGN